MGKLYDYCAQIQQHIDSSGADVFRTRGALALKCGFLVTLITADEPDDPKKIEDLRLAAREIGRAHV